MAEQPASSPQSRTDQERQQKAEAILRQVRLDSETIGSSSLSRLDTAVPEDDGVEIWGRRIGRSLGVIAVLVILWQLAKMLLAGR